MADLEGSLTKAKYGGSGGYETPALNKAGQPGADMVIGLIRAGEAFALVGTGKNQKKEMNPRIVRAFQGPQGITVARCVIAACNQDPDLKATALNQGLDLEGWSEMLDEADREARERPKNDK